MRVLVVGSGGREHALAWSLSRSDSLDELHAAPGNPGIAALAHCHPVRADDHAALVSLARELRTDLVVVGPEVPLVAGLADELRHRGVAVFGPSAAAARIEGSKSFAKEVMDAAGVPTARTLPIARPPCVVKVDGLAAGKGVWVCRTQDELDEGVRAAQALGQPFHVEELLEGPELSVFALAVGEAAVAFPPARDYKRIGDGDTGPNTGGMGAYSPVPFVSQTIADQAMERCVLPTLHALRGRGIDYRGVLYAGLMLTDEGPKIVEYNVRFGDPEAQVLLPRFTSDPAELLLEAAEGKLRSTPTFTSDAALTVALCSEGYPATPRTGDPVEGIADAERVPGVTVFCAGVGEGMVTAGGRVLNVTALAPTIREARDRAYDAVGRISWPGMHFRTDIAAAAIS